MVNFIIGTAGSGKSHTVCDMIKNEIENGTRDVVLIVPEQQAVSWETRMSELLLPYSNLRLEITNFTRLPNSVFREYGGLADTVIDEGSRALIVWRAMLAMKDELVTYKAGDNGHEDRAIPFLMKAVDELKQSSVSPSEAEAALEELERINESDDDGERGMLSSLIARLNDAVHVYGAYNAILHEDFIDRGDVLENLAKTLRIHPYFKGKAVFVDSFFSLTAPEERILEIIMRQADELTVTFTCPTDGDKRLSSVQFGETTEYMKRIKALAVRAGLEVREISLTENYRHAHSKELSAVEKMLFSDAETESRDGEKGKSRDVKIIKCADRYDEAEACASVIQKLLRDGYRYSDIAVVAHDIGTREGIIDTVLRRHGIKCFMSESSDVCSSPAVKLILSALSVAAGGWQRRDMIRLYKTGMTPCGGGEFGELEGDVFESYTYTWNIRGKKMYSSGDWTMNPEGYREEMSESGAEILRAANECRRKIVPPLERYLSVFGDGRGLATVREIAERTVDFANEYGVGGTLDGMCEKYRRLGMDKEALKCEKSWDYVCEILDKMVSVIGDCPLNVVRFARLFAYVAADMDKGTIPTGIDEVILGSASGVRFDSQKCVILLGAVEDEFPSSVADSGDFFDDGDKIALESVGLRIASPDSETALSREYFMFYRAAAAATDKLCVLAPTGDGSKLSSGASDIERIMTLLGKDCVSVFGDMPLSEILFDRVSAEYLLSRRTDEKEIVLLRSFAGEYEGKKISLTAENDSILPRYGRGERITLSQSAIERFVGCPFMYCCERMIKVKPEKKAEVRLGDIGTFIHRVFERFFTEIPAEKISSGEITADEMRETADGIIREYMDSLAEASGRGKGDYDGRIKYLLERLSRYVLVFIEAMTNELRQSKFVPAAFELPIGMKEDGKKSADAIRFTTEDGCTVSLRGIADRVDIYDSPDGKRYVRIVDYKTGAKEFSLDNISHGLDVQLLIYLFSIWKLGMPEKDGREIVPAGAVYFSTRPAVGNARSITSSEENREKLVESVTRSGVLLDDAEVLRAMEETLGGRFIPATEKDGVVVSSDKHTFLLTLDDFGKLYNELGDTLVRIADEMRGGKACAKPGKAGGGSEPCEYCEYAYICKNRKQ